MKNQDFQEFLKSIDEARAIRVGKHKASRIMTFNPKQGKAANVAVVTTRGRLVIPSSMRRRHGIKRGTRISFVEEGNKIILTPLTPAYFQRSAGILGTGGRVLKALLEEHAIDCERENR